MSVIQQRVPFLDIEKSYLQLEGGDADREDHHLGIVHLMHQMALKWNML
jgi:hypothetical protein